MSRFSHDGAEDRLNGPELRRRIEPTIEDKRRVLAVARDDVLPHTWQPFRGIRAEEVAEGRLAESVEMFVRPKKRWLRVKTYARLFTNLADRRGDQPLVLMNTASRNLGSCIGMVAMVEDEQTVLPFDVDDNSLPEWHPDDRKSLGTVSSAGPACGKSLGLWAPG